MHRHIDTLSVAMVANNIGHTEDSNRSGKFHGSFTQSSTEPQIQPNLFERMNNCNKLLPRIFAAQNKFRSKFRVALTPSRNMSLKVRAVQNNTCLENSQKCCRSFISVKNSSKSQEFRRTSSTDVCITFAQYCIYDPFD